MTGKIKKVTYSLTAILIVALLMIVGVRDNLVKSAKISQSEFLNIECSSVNTVESEDAPLGVAEEFTFIMPEISHDLTLMFHTSHSFVEVYMADELVYSVKASPDIAFAKTTSGLWNTIHVCHESSGKEFRVIVMPVYEGFLSQNVDFILGDAREFLLQDIRNSVPELVVTTLAVLIGLIFVILGIYFRYKTKSAMNIISLGMFSLSIGVWRFFEFSFLSLILKDKTVFVYYISLTMLMISMIPLLESVKKKFRPNWQKLFDSLALIISLTSIGQLALQLFGVISLREMLKVTHLTIIASLLLIMVCLVAQLIKPAEGEKRKFDFTFVLVTGIALDLLLYYVTGSTIVLMLSIISIIIYVISEVVRFVVIYTEKEAKLLSSELKLAQNETELAQARFTTMMSQIRSHFIFNILNAISGMCKYDPEKADRTIVHFARFLRSNIDIMQNDDLVHFNNALRHIEDYVELEQVRYGDKIHFETDIQIDNFVMPPLVIQPLVENAIIHGLVPKRDGGTITLRTKKDAENIYITVEDNGVGFDDKMNISEKSIGLQNIRFRLEQAVKGSVKIESIVGLGTKSTIIIPREEAEQCD
ncbi:MAG: histidine kinase [Clostridia bacterium]|nr:histidine kinase [Clostridia bacterium]